MLKEKEKKERKAMRRKDREITDREEIRAILERARVLHLGINGEERPYVVALHYGLEWKDGLPVFYIHSAREGRKLELLRRDGRAFVEIDTDEALVSGGEIPCQYGAAYASVMCQAQAEILPEGEEKRRALQILMKTQTGRDFAITPEMAKNVAVVRLRAETLSAKARRV